MATMTDADLAAIEARAEATTAGPWRRTDGLGDITGTADTLVARGTWPHDGAFIAAARVDVPALVAEVRAGRAEIARLRAALEHIAGGGISPAIGFARRTLDGADVLTAHRAAVAEWDAHR